MGVAMAACGPTPCWLAPRHLHTTLVSCREGNENAPLADTISPPVVVHLVHSVVGERGSSPLHYPHVQQLQPTSASFSCTTSDAGEARHESECFVQPLAPDQDGALLHPCLNSLVP